MKLQEILTLIRLKPPSVNRQTRQLNACKTVEDLHRLARRRVPRSIADYVDGGADEELTLAHNTQAFRAHRFTPDVLADVAEVDLTTSLFGQRISLPFGYAPTGYTRMISSLGEPAVAASAGRAGIPYVLSTMATTSIEDLSELQQQPVLDKWFQLYVWKDRELTYGLIDRANQSGFRVLEIAVDTAVSGYRVRDVRNGLTIPPQLTFKALLDIGIRPRYWTKLLSSPGLEFANVGGGAGGGYTIENVTMQFDPSVDWAEIGRIRSRWNGPLVLKGPIGPNDALRARELGVDGVHLSNHGGRQLDRTVAPIDLVAPVRQALGGSFGIVVDSGVRHGSDVATAVALGADAAFVGRPYLWALMAAGEPGLDLLIKTIRDQLERTLQLLGVRSIDELSKRGHALLTE